MDNLMVFDYLGDSVRAIVENGEAWFVAADVCKVLGIGNVTNAVKRLDDRDKGLQLIKTLGGKQTLNVVNESGVYNLVFTSHRPEAKEFKRWVTSEVLPSIRKTGAYMTDEVLEMSLRDPQYMIGVLTALRDEKLAHETAKAKIALDAPKVKFAEQVCSADNTVSVGDFAKIVSGNNGINYGRNKLFEKLREKGIVDQNNIPYQQFINAGYFEVIETIRNFKLNRTTRVTGKGQYWLTRKLLEWDEKAS